MDNHSLSVRDGHLSRYCIKGYRHLVCSYLQIADCEVIFYIFLFICCAKTRRLMRIVRKNLGFWASLWSTHHSTSWILEDAYQT